MLSRTLLECSSRAEQLVISVPKRKTRLKSPPYTPCFVIRLAWKQELLDSGWRSDGRRLFVSVPDMCQTPGTVFGWVFCFFFHPHPPLDPLQRGLELKIIFDGSWFPSKQTPSADPTPPVFHHFSRKLTDHFGLSLLEAPGVAERLKRRREKSPCGFGVAANESRAAARAHLLALC